MINKTITLFGLGLLFAASTAFAQNTVRFQQSGRLDENGIPINLRGATSVRVSDDELSAKKTAQPSQFVTKFEGRKAELPENLSILGDIYENSEVLIYGDYHTIVPKGALIYIPPTFKKRISKGPQPQSQLVWWPEFYSKNRGWITHREITIEQVEGRGTFPEDVVEVILTDHKVVVATHEQGPVTCLTPLSSEKQQPNESP